MDNLIEKAKKLLQLADSGSDECKYYNNGFIDGVKYAEQQLKNCNLQNVSKSFYCQREIEGNETCKEQCDHCKEYYAPLEGQ